MNKYCIYYIPKSEDPESDLLMIYFGENQQVSNRFEQNGIKVLLSGDNVVGFVLYNFSKLCKIKTRGMVYKPIDSLVDVINSELDNANLPTLEYMEESGYVVAKIIDKKKLKDSYCYLLDTNKEKIYSESTSDLDAGENVVVALNGTYLLPARMIVAYEINKDKNLISGGRICTLRDLQIFEYNDLDSVAILDKDTPIGIDFFVTEAKGDA